MNKPIMFSHIVSMVAGALLILGTVSFIRTPDAQAAGNVWGTQSPARSAVIVTTADYPSGGNVTQTAGAIVVNNPITKTITVVGYVGGSYNGSNTMGLSAPQTFNYQ